MEIRLKLKVKDVEIELSKEEAIELAETLNELTGKQTVYVDRWHYPWYRDTWTKPEITWTSNAETSFAKTISDDVHIYASNVWNSKDLEKLVTEGT